MKRICEKCEEEFELTPDKPGRIGVCLNCIRDPERLANVFREFQLPGYKKVGLPMKFDVPVGAPSRKRP